MVQRKRRSRQRQRARRKLRKQAIQALVDKAEGCLGPDRFERRKERIAKDFSDGLKTFIGRSIPLPTALDVVRELVEDPIVRAILEQLEVR